MKKFLSVMLTISMILSIMSINVGAASYISIADTSGVLAVGAEGEYSTVYYGGIPWRVLSKNYSDGQANPTDGILLLSEHAMANGIQYNAHYSNNAWSSKNKAWASAMVLPWDDERNPMYESNMANGTKTDDSSGGYITSDVRMYLTGLGTYETFRPFAYYNESWPASWTTFADGNGQGWRYYTRNIVTDAEPVPGVTYFVKGDFELSDHNRNNNEGWLPITAADFRENTWYTLDSNNNPVLMESFPEGVSTVNAYYDQTGYSIADVSNGFEPGVTYYTFERYLENACPPVTVNGTEVAMGEHLASLFKWVGYAVPDMTVSDHNYALIDTTFVAGVPASEKNFASDMGFSEVEVNAVLPTNGHGYNRGSGFNGGWSGKIGSTFADRLDNDTYFLLSGEEVKNYLTAAGHTKPATHLDGTAAGDLWTRSWGRADIQTVITYANNAVNWYKGANTYWQSIRPAFNLNPNSVALFKEIEDNTYKMSLKDDSRNFNVTVSADGIAYTGAVVGENEYISAIVKDANGDVTAYEKIAPVTSEDGVIDLDAINADLTDKTLYLFNEQCNDEYATDYASEMVETPVGEAVIGTTVYPTLAKAFENVADGETIGLIKNVKLSRSIAFAKDISFTLDGNGFTISPAEGSTEGNSAFNVGMGDDSTRATRNYNFTDIVFDGWTTDHVLRCQGITTEITNCSFINSNQPDGLGLVTLTFADATVENCVFADNNCVKAIDINSWGDGSLAKVEIDDCLFENNDVSGNGVVLCSDGDGITVNDSEFIGNNVTCATNGATLYAGYNSNIVITGNLFKDNTVTISGRTEKAQDKVSGGLFAGFYGETGHNISGNAFVGNSSTIDGVAAVKSAAYSAGYSVEGNFNGNYWDGIEPVDGVDYINDRYYASRGDLVLTEYYASYSLDAEGNVVLDDVKPVIAKNVAVQYIFNETESDADEGLAVYDIAIVTADSNIINRLNTADLTFVNSSSKVAYEIVPAEDITLTANGDNRYMFNFKGKDNVNDTADTIIIGQVKFIGYDAFTFKIDENAATNLVTATTMFDNIVTKFAVNKGLTVNTDIDTTDDYVGIIDTEIKVPTRKLTINVDFPNAVEGNEYAYQKMLVKVSGEDIETMEYELGTDVALVDGKYTIEVEDALTLNTSYTVEVSGEGYRTARYTVTMTDAKVLNFWNNVKDVAFEVEEGKSASAKNVTFLAGDIVKDANINIYDLSAVVSYFGTIDLKTNVNADKYIKYDLNRDGKIDSKDVAYVLVSWGK